MNFKLSRLLPGTLVAAFSVQAAVTVQDPGNVIGTGDSAWSYLILEAEDYDTKLNESEEFGFIRVDHTGTRTSALGNPVLGADTKASKQGALFTQTTFAEHADQVTYNVQFSIPGTYYLYMRFTMFENGGNETHYLNEDSFFVPPDFGLDPQTDWPLSNRGGYTEGCCNLAGYLFFPDENGDRVSKADGGEEGQAFWEGNFHWNELLSSQFLNAEEQGEPVYRFRYEVTEDRVGQPLSFTISYREGGTTIDLFLFATSPSLMTDYTQAQLDELLLGQSSNITVQDPGNVVGSGESAWSYLILEAEDYDTKLNESEEFGFIRVDHTGTRTSALGNPVLGADTTASKQGALFTQTTFAEHADQVTYNVQFSIPGTYYLYMRFTMFENGGNETHYLNEDSFFVPPDFGLDPQTDWPLSNRGGYTEGCCNLAGYLFFPDENGDRVSKADGGEEGQAFWEGNFHWNELLSSQFLNAEEQGEPVYRFRYEVTEDRVGQPLTFTISYREGGTTIDLFLFATSPSLMTDYTQAQLDEILLGTATAVPSLDIRLNGSDVVISWPAALSDFTLRTTGSLTPPGWNNVSAPVVVVGDRNTVTVSAGEAEAYFELFKP